MVDDDEFDAFNEPAPGYWRALGKFLHQFARLERTLHSTLCHFSGIESPMAQAVFSGLRADACIGAIKRILEAMDDDEVAERLENPLAWVGVISNARNHIIHWGAFPTAGADLISINDFLAHSPERLRSIPVTCAILADLNSDTHKIQVHLLAETLIGSEPTSIEREVYEKAFRPILERAWRYKHPPQSIQDPALQARIRSRKLQRDASRASRAAARKK